ncbi:hypothetical protein QR680_003511 [Steinernema hermaphroditum]|uniref:Uncharacterized protein n=1 Tax=Steinernema hermaphroditum TaxID=289476 RepID=A0AA39HMV7_9BILA|nr:hypothetical protein QR680_003511 [Steinernema hermaphroditum]
MSLDYLTSLFHNQCAVVEKCTVTVHQLTKTPDMRCFRLDVAVAVPSTWSSLFRYSLKKVDVETGAVYETDLEDPDLDHCWLGSARILGTDRSIYDDSIKATWSSEMCQKFCHLLSLRSGYEPCCLEISRIGVTHNDTNQILETVVQNASFTDVALLRVQHPIKLIETGLRNWINSGNLAYLTVEDSAIQMDFTSEFITQPQVLKIIDGSESDDSLLRILESWFQFPHILRGKEVKLRLPPKFERYLEKYGKSTASKGSNGSKSFIFIQHKLYSDCVVIIEVFSVLKANLSFR